MWVDAFVCFSEMKVEKKTPVGGRTLFVTDMSHLVTESGDVEGGFLHFLCWSRCHGRREGTVLSYSVF